MQKKTKYILGACAGVALDLASGEQPYYSLVFTLAGLLCGLCRDRRKGWAALVYVLACSVAVLWSWDGGRHMGLPLEALVGAILWALLWLVGLYCAVGIIVAVIVYFSGRQ